MACYNPKPAYLMPIELHDKATGELKLSKQLFFIKKSQINEFHENITMIPCGKCIGCRLDKANDWATRCTAEAKQWKTNCFITLTYNDEKIPKNNSLRKKDLTDFWKRLRYYHKGIEKRYWKGKEEYPIRYFSCGEYGGQTGRPHYHAGIFNWRPTDLKLYKTNIQGDKLYTSEELNKIWENGFVIIGEMTYESACYIARYVQKKAYGYDNKHFEKKGLEGEFVETSRKGGIAYQLIEDKEQFKKMKRNMGIFVWNKKQGQAKLKKIPTFLRNKWKDIENYEYYAKNAERTETIKKMIEEEIKKSGKTPKEYRDIKLRSLLEKTKTLHRNNIT